MKKKYSAPSVSWMEFQTEDILATSAVDPVGTFTIGESSGSSSGSSGSTQISGSGTDTVGADSTNDEPWPSGWDTMFDNLDVF